MLAISLIAYGALALVGALIISGSSLDANRAWRRGHKHAMEQWQDAEISRSNMRSNSRWHVVTGEDGIKYRVSEADMYRYRDPLDYHVSSASYAAGRSLMTPSYTDDQGNVAPDAFDR